MKWATVSHDGLGARFRRLENLLSVILGLAPQALCFRLLRRLRTDPIVDTNHLPPRKLVLQ